MCIKYLILCVRLSEDDNYYPASSFIETAFIMLFFLIQKYELWRNANNRTLIIRVKLLRSTHVCMCACTGICTYMQDMYTCTYLSFLMCLEEQDWDRVRPPF